MAFFELSNKSVNANAEQKAFYPTQSFADFLFSKGLGDLGSVEAIRLYYQCKPFFHAVKKRSTSFCSIRPRVWDENREEFVDDHPVLMRLKHPNPFQSYEAWAMELSEFFDITGNAFPVATGNITRPPLELFNERPQTVDLDEGKNTFYFPQTITVSRKQLSDIYRLDEVRNNGVTTARYYHDRDKEIWHIRDSNLSYTIDGLWGVGKAQPIWLEIQQFIEANVNNLSVLEKGGRPSMIWKWMHDQPMTDPQFVRARQELKKYEGAINAGRQVIADHIEPVPVSINNKDMQFAENRRTVEHDIYNIFDIPLATVIADAMTMDNLKVSDLILWRNAVLPLAGILFGELTRFLLPRYGDFQGRKVEDMKITFNPFDISVLEAAKVRETSELSNIGILTDNELRSQIGWESYEGGDIIYKPMSVLPAGTDRDTDTNLEEPLTKSQKFLEKLMELRRVDGTKVFNETELSSHISEEST